MEKILSSLVSLKETRHIFKSKIQSLDHDSYMPSTIKDPLEKSMVAFIDELDKQIERFEKIIESEKVLKPLKSKLSSDIVDFFDVMRMDLQLDRTEYRWHFTKMADNLFEIDRCESIDQLEALYERGNLDICGVPFNELVEEIIGEMIN